MTVVRSAGLARLLCVSLLAALSACGSPGGYGGTAWDGRRGYDGNGDYGYDIAAPGEARGYLARAARAYPEPGPPGDPWQPYIREASSRYGVPEAWIRGVMRQESGGRQLDSDGSLITSGAGAMGLMQVMPGTWEMLRSRYGLGSDPFEPHDNILAGTAYLREMYDRFGAPAFLAAYNAGPERVDAYLAGASGLPDETVNYVASIGPRIGMAASFGAATPAYAARPPVAWQQPEVAMAPVGTDPDPRDAAYEGGGAVGDDAAYAGGGMTGEDYNRLRR